MKKLIGKISHKIWDSYLRRILFYIGDIRHCKKNDITYPPSVKCFCQIKNEVDIIEDWIIYHGYLFGYENIYVIDDGSDDGTENIIQRYEHLINVIWLSPDQGGIPMKIINLNKIMSTIKNECDFLIPIDSDEFVLLPNTANREEILYEFYKYNKFCWGLFKFDKYYESVTSAGFIARPVQKIYTFKRVDTPYHMKKVFFRSINYESVGFGQHYGYLNSLNKVYKRAYISKLCLYHYQWRGIDQMKKKVLNNTKGYDYFNIEHRGGNVYKSGYESHMRGDFSNFIANVLSRGHDTNSKLLASKLSELRQLREC